MANPLELLLFSLLDLLKGSIVIAIPLFILIVIGKWLRERIQAKTKWTWLFSALAATFALVWTGILLLYFLPFLLALNESGIGEIPAMFAPSAGDVLASYIFGLVKVSVSAAVVSLVLMPFELIGAFIFEWVMKKRRKANKLVNLFIASYIASVISAAIVLFIIPEAVTGILFFIYFG
ncbi:MAG TPA: hypothetical protein VJH23_03285 [archaeon]|nr:hypothetical protein [archaeon]